MATNKIMANRDYHKEWRDRNKESEEYKQQSRNRDLRKRYGIDQDGYDKLFDAQAGKCAICGAPAEEQQRGLFIDHNHSTSEVRGLLCDPCNRGVGSFKDDPERLVAAAAYLIKGQGSSCLTTQTSY